MSNTNEVNTETVYVTRWGLTQGIRVYPPGLGSIDSSRRYFQGGKAGFSASDPAYCFVGPTDWTTDLEEAKARVRKKAARKVKSLKKQLAEAERAINDLTSIAFVDALVEMKEFR